MFSAGQKPASRVKANALEGWGIIGTKVPVIAAAFFGTSKTGKEL
jgi:hypothetical protein